MSFRGNRDGRRRWRSSTHVASFHLWKQVVNVFGLVLVAATVVMGEQ